MPESVRRPYTFIHFECDAVCAAGVETAVASAALLQRSHTVASMRCCQINCCRPWPKQGTAQVNLYILSYLEERTDRKSQSMPHSRQRGVSGRAPQKGRPCAELRHAARSTPSPLHTKHEVLKYSGYACVLCTHTLLRSYAQTSLFTHSTIEAEVS